MEQKNYTIGEIARICGTSKATVSRVFNHPEIVTPELREKVLAAIREHGFTPNPFAKRLGAQNNWGIAVFVFDIINPFFALLVREIGHLTMAKRIPLTVCDTENDLERERVYLDYLLANKISGIIFTEGISASLVDRARSQVPVVLIDQHYVPEIVAEVTSDNHGGAFKATDHLIQLNHQRIGFVSGPLGFPSARDRMAGYRDALERNGIAFDPRLAFQGSFLYESGSRALEYFLSLTPWPTAVFCANDQMAVGVLNKARELNISVPGDISLVGFDAIQICGMTTPKLTTVKQDIPALCRHAVDMLLAQLDGRPTASRVVVPTSLVVGETCKKIGSAGKGRSA